VGVAAAAGAAGWHAAIAGPLIDDSGMERTKLARALLRCLLYQITESGVFHADPHPGNILLLTNGGLALLDLGSVGRLDAQLRSRCRTSSSPSGAATPQGSAMPCWNWSPAATAG
jgi:hypothetical protein